VPETEKQKRARLIFEHFSKLCDAIPSSSFEVWEDTPNDPPDICVGNYDLGIEITEFYYGSGQGGSEMKARENAFEQIVAMAKTQFEEQYPVPLWVRCSWSDNRPKKSQFHEIASAVVDAIQKHLPISEGQSVKIEWDDFAETCLVHYLRFINVKALSTLTSSHWTNLQVAWIGNEEVELLERFTREKEKDLPKYKTQFNAAWLVIVAPGDGLSSTVIPDEPLEPGCISSAFDRVYFYDIFSKQVFLLTEKKS